MKNIIFSQFTMYKTAVIGITAIKLLGVVKNMVVNLYSESGCLSKLPRRDPSKCQSIQPMWSNTSTPGKLETSTSKLTNKQLFFFIIKSLFKQKYYTFAGTRLLSVSISCFSLFIIVNWIFWDLDYLWDKADNVNITLGSKKMWPSFDTFSTFIRW